ncbi:MAG: cache domain-containing protein [bacterium]|nr:cache domain-containing protein [bacterium]
MKFTRLLPIVLAMATAVAATAVGVGAQDEGSAEAAAEAPPRAAGRAYARYLVAEAIERYDAEGRAATLEHLNSPAALDGEWYVFVADSDGISLANANRTDIVGTDRSNATDVTGKNYGQEIMAATAEGRWVDYYFTHPETGEDTLKHTWAVRHDDLIFGSGWHRSGEVPAKSDVAAYTQHLVIEAIERYEADGREAVIEYYNNPDTVDGQWYVFIDHPDGTILSNAGNPDTVGTDLSGYTDVNGKLFGPEILAAGTGGRWVDYYFTDPSDGVDRRKHSWVIRYDDLLFGSGWYQVPEAAAADTDETSDGEMADDTADETGPTEDSATG